MAEKGETKKSKRTKLLKSICIIALIILSYPILYGLHIVFPNIHFFVLLILIDFIFIIFLTIYFKLWKSKKEFAIAMVSILIICIVGIYIHTSFIELNKQPELVFNEISSNFSNNSTHSWLDMNIYIKNIGEESTIANIRVLAISYYGILKYDIIDVFCTHKIKPDKREMLSGSIEVNPDNPIPDYILLRLIYNGEIVDERKYNP